GSTAGTVRCQPDRQPAPMSAITLSGLTKRFGTVVAVDDLHLDVQDGELMALLGPSGCGKTTTLRAIAGFELPDSGDIDFGDHRVTNLPPERRNIGMVFQNYALFPHMTVAQNVAFGLEMRKESALAIRTRVATTLAKVQLTGLEGRYPRQLSGGQQQRAALARALVVDPALGTLRCGGLAPGTDAKPERLIAVRPEAIQLSGRSGGGASGAGDDVPGPRGADPTVNRLRGVVRARAFLGNLVDYRVEVASGVVLRVQGDPHAPFAVGDSVNAAFQPRSTWSVPAREERVC